MYLEWNLIIAIKESKSKHFLAISDKITSFSIYTDNNPIQDGTFLGCSHMGAKRCPSQQSVTNIIQ